jgi:sugar/nucleoside kinase (ribokinase family)
VPAPAAPRAVAAARPRLRLTPGGEPGADGGAAAAADQQVAAVQTSLDEADAADAEALATDLLARLRPAAAVVTLGRLGALARTASGIHRAAAPPVAVAHTHGAGAAFSAGYAHAWLNGGGVEAALNAGCRAGATHCAIPATVPPGRTTTALAAS